MGGMAGRFVNSNRHPPIAEPIRGPGQGRLSTSRAADYAPGKSIAQTKVHEVAGSVWQDFGLVFTRDDGAPLRPAHLTRVVKAESIKGTVRRQSENRPGSSP